MSISSVDAILVTFGRYGNVQWPCRAMLHDGVKSHMNSDIGLAWLKFLPVSHIQGIAMRLTRILIFVQLALVAVVAACTTGCASHRPTKMDVHPSGPVKMQTVRVELSSGSTEVDVYVAATGRPQPLVVVAHGFMRSRANMALWGRRLAEEGFVAAVPDLPAWADHPRNGSFINELIERLTASPPEGMTIDTSRIGLMGFSAGGLATLLAAADNPAVKVWVGLDPVDRNGMGAATAGKLRCRVSILRAEPSSANANGNAVGIERAMNVSFTGALVPQATHADLEWPTDWKAELVCGKSSEVRRAEFVKHALTELKAALLTEMPTVAPTHRPTGNQ